MPRLIYKQWHRNANRPNTAANNAQHIKYIGERIHALKDPENINGLFGQINGKYSNQITTKDAMSYVRKFSKNGITMYRAVISFKEEDAALLELGEDKKRWENYIKYHIYTIAKHNHIEINNLEYLAAVHLKKNQPHVHISFWNKAQKIRVNYVSPQVPNSIREDVEESTFNDLKYELSEGDSENPLTSDAYELDNGNAIRKELISKTFENERKVLHETQNQLFAELSKGTVNALTEIENVDDLYSRFQRLADAVPKSGKLAYEYMPDDIKEQINEFSELLLDLFSGLREYYDDYLFSKRTEAEMYNSIDSNYGKYNIATVVGKAKDSLDKSIGNKILRAIKKFNIEKSIAKATAYKQREAEIKEMQTERLCLSILRVLKTFAYNGQAELAEGAKKAFGRGGDMSRAEILDLIYKTKDKSSLEEDEQEI